MVCRQRAAGTISQTARGFSSFLTRSTRESAPTAWSLTSSLTACARPVKDNAAVPFRDQPSHHVGAHAAKSYHSELHKFSSLQMIQHSASKHRATFARVPDSSSCRHCRALSFRYRRIRVIR